MIDPETVHMTQCRTCLANKYGTHSRCPVCRSQYVNHYTMYRCRRCEREWERFEDAEECCEGGVD
jgi:predicted amidophosphoribosyltransferase